MNESDPTTKWMLIVEAALDRKAERPIVLDVRKLTSYADTRERYDLERLWRDAPRIDLEIEGIDSNPPPLSGDSDLEGDIDRKLERAEPTA